MSFRIGLTRLTGVILAASLLTNACTSDDAPSDRSDPITATSAPDEVGSEDEVGSDTGIDTTAPRDVRSDERVRWRQMPIGAGGFVTGIVSAVGDTGPAIYARTDVGGAYRWLPDQGEWEQLIRASRLLDGDLGPGDSSVASIAVAPSDVNVVYAAVGDDFDPPAGGAVEGAGRVLASNDGGRTWISSDRRWFVDGNQRFRTGSERLAVHPDNPAIVVFGTQREGVWISEDAGATWRQVDPSVIPPGITSDEEAQQPGVSSVAFGPAGDLTQLHVGVTGVGLFVSVDTGETWELLHQLESGIWPGSAQFVANDLVTVLNSGADPGTGPEHGQLLRISSTGDVRQIQLPRRARTWIVAIDPSDPDFWVLTDGSVRDGHLWSSVDAGNSWRVHDVEIETGEIPWLGRTDLADWMSAGRLMFDPMVAGKLWFAEGMGVWTADSFESRTIRWSIRSRGIEELVVSDIVVPPGSVPVVVTADRQGFLIDPEFERYPVSTLVDRAFASGSRVDFSDSAPSTMAWVGAQSNIATAPDRHPRGAVSSDGGLTWTEMGGLDREMYGGEIAVSATDPTVMIWRPTSPSRPADGVYLGLRVSDDGGRSWRTVDVDGGVDSFHRYFWWFTRRSLTSDRVDGSFYLMSDDARLFVSRDDGQTWTAAVHAPPCTLDGDCHVFGQLRSAPDRAGELWASTALSGLHRSVDTGDSPWEPVGDFAEVRAFDFGAPAPGSNSPSVVAHARRQGDDELGVWWSNDGASSWELLSAAPFDLATSITAVAGDPIVHGRIYVGFAGNGAVVGEVIRAVDPRP